VLTRLPSPRRFGPTVALDYLRRRFELPPVVLSPTSYEALLELAARERLAGGTIYDGVIGATAKELGATLVTLDRRAERTYRALGVDYRLIT
jgi:predicted nucleic acid-binding protein